MSDLYSDSEAPWDSLARHLAGEATPEEQDRLRAWVVARPERLGLLTDATRAWERAGARPVPTLFSNADVEAAWQRFRPHMHLAPAAPVADTSLQDEPKPVASEATGAAGTVIQMRPPAPFSVRPLLRVAAVLLLLVGVAYAFRSFRAQLLPTAALSVAAGNQKRLLTLPDGSRVWLNRYSTLEYAPDLGKENREVSLVGEAFFEVRKDQGRPFTVLTGTSRTRVLGTSFNVRAYQAEDSVEVAVVTGRVVLARRTAATPDSVLLTAKTRGVLHTKATATGPVAQLRRRAAVDANFRAWQTGELVFDNASLSHVVRTLRTTFGTRVTVADASLLNCRFTGTFRQPAPGQVLTVVSMATNSELRGTPSTGFVLSGAGCP
jgi:ferric-dicitrate binding protein FerR (iron transport regulator)